MIREDILDVAGLLQLCAGQMVGSEAAIHAIRQSFDKEENEALLCRPEASELASCI